MMLTNKSSALWAGRAAGAPPQVGVRPVASAPLAASAPGIARRAVQARAYDDDDDDEGYGRRGARGGGGGRRDRDRRGGGKKNYRDEEEEWDMANAEEYVEAIQIPGVVADPTPAAQAPSASSSSNGYGYGGVEGQAPGGGYDRGQQRPQRGGFRGGRGGYGSGRGDGQGYGNRGGEGYAPRGEGYAPRGDGYAPRGDGQQGQGQGQGGYRRNYAPRGDGQQGQGYGGPRGGGGYGGPRSEDQQQQGGYNRYNNRYNNRGDGQQQQDGADPTQSGQEGGFRRNNWKGPREAMSPEQLAARQANNDAVREARDWRVCAGPLLEAKGNQLDSENIVQMLFKIAKDDTRPKTSDGERPTFEALVAQLYGWMAHYLPTLRPRQLAICLYSIAKLELFNADLVAGLVKRASEVLGNLSSWEYSNMVWALARMSYAPGAEWLEKFTFWTEKKLSTFRPVELSNMVTALAKLGHRPSTEWLTAAGAAAAAQAKDFNNLEYVNLLFGLASLGFTGGDDAASWLGPLVGSDPRRVGGMRIMELTKTCWSLSQFDWRPEAEWLDSATRAFFSQLRYCTPADMSTLSYSLAYLRAQPNPDNLRLLSEALARSWERLSGDELANCTMSLAIWQFKTPSERWLDELVITAKDRLPVCSADGLNKFVSALPLLGSGYRLNQVVAQAQAMLNAANGQQQEAVEGGDSQQAVEAAEPAMAAV